MNRKLDTAGVFERLFETYQAQFTLLVPAALIVFLPVALINGALAAGGGVALALLGAVVGLVANYWLQGMVIEAVRDIQDGRRDFTIGGLFQSVMPVLLPLIGIGVLAGLGIVIGLLVFIVPGLILLTWWSVVGPVVVIERRGMDAFSRSRELVRGNGWQVFGVIVVVVVIQIVANAFLSAIFGRGFLGGSIAQLVSGALIAPIGAIAAALVYLELRQIKEGDAPHAGGDLSAAPESPFGGPAEPAQPSPFGDAPDPPRTPPPPPGG
ncbi:MAG TPA: hypothetical protein VF529_01535 [Solirubrobacteraceae bacterium]|jgi:hypothetical protein